MILPISAVDEDDIAYLRSQNLFSEEFLEYLRSYRFHGDIYAMPEGTVIYPNEPLVTVVAPLLDAQLIETALLLEVNHQSLIATKANRIVRAAKGRGVSDFGARRAHNVDAAVYGARAAYIGGVTGTATVLAGEMFQIPISGTMAHSWVMFCDSEYEAFKKYAETYPDSTVLLVDTYDVLKSGIPNAIRVAKEVLEPMGKRLRGVRLDSGDLAYLSKEARKMLDEAGLEDCLIVASNGLDEYTIRSIIHQGAKIDSFGVGERLITSASNPVFGAVYKMAAVKKDGKLIPKIKVSETAEKITNPGLKKIYRVYNEEGKAIADYLALFDEVIDDGIEATERRRLVIGISHVGAHFAAKLLPALVRTIRVAPVAEAASVGRVVLDILRHRADRRTSVGVALAGHEEDFSGRERVIGLQGAADDAVSFLVCVALNRETFVLVREERFAVN